MTTLLFIWYLTTMPADRLACSLWVSAPPSQEALVAACGFDDVGRYRLDVISIGAWETVCTRPGDSLASVDLDCVLPQSLDHYRLQLVEPEYSTLVCSLELDHVGDPTPDDIATLCPHALTDWLNGRLAAHYVGSRLAEAAAAPMCSAPSLSFGSGLYDQVGSAADLYTDEQLSWLAGRFIWYGRVKPECDGGTSGLDPETLAANACGLAASRPMLTSWQNQFDDAIYSAAIASNVPARLIKRVMQVESQFWPFWSTDAGEYGMMQITESGVDVLLRFDPGLSALYPRLPLDEQYDERTTVLNVLACWYCSLDQALAHTRELIPIYARMLAAYRCRAVEINPALGGDAAWRQAVADYNGSASYLVEVEQ